MTGVTNAEIRPEPPEDEAHAILAALDDPEGAGAPDLGAWARAALEEGVEP